VTIEEMQNHAYLNSVSKGFHDGELNIPEKLALIHSEVSEALEALREGRMSTILSEDKGKPEGFPSELADIIIRVGDLAGRLRINLTEEIERKMAYNQTRERKHGKAF
jgi:NTP pyrophosphatase (non-canonical NTP hydrolase)